MTKQTEISHDTQSVLRIYSRLKPLQDVWHSDIRDSVCLCVCVWLREELFYLAHAYLCPLF